VKISIISIHNQGDQTKEYVSLKANSDIAVWTHILTDTTYTKEGNVSSLLRHMYWIPVAAKKGDSIFIHTKSGTYSSIDNSDKTKTHHCYWGLKTPVWNNDGDGAVLFEIAEWTHKKKN
jgi:hypothetical protein